MGKNDKVKIKEFENKYDSIQIGYGPDYYLRVLQTGVCRRKLREKWKEKFFEG